MSYNETQQNRTAENKAIKNLCKVWNVKYKPYTKKVTKKMYNSNSGNYTSSPEGALFKGGVCFASIEFKERHNRSDKYRTYDIEKDKLDIVKNIRSGMLVVLIKFDDGYKYFIHTKKHSNIWDSGWIQTKKRNYSNPKKPAYCIDPINLYDINDLTLIKQYWK